MTDSMNFSMFCADQLQDCTNTYYPHKHVVNDTESLKAAVSHDYVCASYKDAKRSNANFIASDCLAMDCDNDSDDPSEWVTPELVAEVFPGVTFGVHYSRNHMRQKDNKMPRPKFHVFFPIAVENDSKAYAAIKQAVLKVFPFFDANAADAGRFFYGTADPQVEWHDGCKDLSTFLAEYEVPSSPSTSTTTGSVQKARSGHTGAAKTQAVSRQETIPVGTRNSTLYDFAVKKLKRYGNTEQMRELFRQECEKCEQPLPVEEKRSIYKNALAYYNDVIRQQEGYDLPAKYEADWAQKKADKDKKTKSFKPRDYTDVEQARQLALHYKKVLRHSPATLFLAYENHCWIESETLARRYAQKLTYQQSYEAKSKISALNELFKQNGMAAILAVAKDRKGARLAMSDEQKVLLDALEDAEGYLKYALSRQDSNRISACLREVTTMVSVDHNDLDAEPFLLNTPGDTYDLRKGLSGARPASPKDLMTRITAVTPSDDGMQIWLDALNTIFCNDQELIDYVQMICGLAAIGQVNLEAMILAYGDGRNGKSSFFNTIARVLGTYSGTISADALTLGCMRNIKPEFAEARGKRLLIAAEFPASARLNDSVLKQLCSTDPIQAEKKYKAPFSFTPSHTLVLYTNHLPQVDATDYGTWRRMIVIPFNARIEGSKEIKNYSNYLFEQAGGAVLSWIIEGAQKAIQANYILPTPKAVEEATGQYKAQSDWFKCFLDDCCDVGDDYKVKSQELYQQYRQYAYDHEGKAHATDEFYKALGQRGFRHRYIKNRAYIQGLRLKSTDIPA